MSKRPLGPRSEAMQGVLDRLAEMERSVAWLARQLSPALTRQAIWEWRSVPKQHAHTIARVLKMRLRDVCPAHFAPDDKKAEDKAA
jgi:hypothetical protein